MAAEKNNNDKHKRRRVAMACEGCRQRKTRCDGVQPICGICLKRKIPCVYGKKYTRAHVSVEYVKGLEEKLGILANDKHRSVDMNRSSSIIREDNLNDNELDRRESVVIQPQVRKVLHIHIHLCRNFSPRCRSKVTEIQGYCYTKEWWN